jgi:hypothetical protein
MRNPFAPPKVLLIHIKYSSSSTIKGDIILKFYQKININIRLENYAQSNKLKLRKYFTKSTIP